MKDKIAEIIRNTVVPVSNPNERTVALTGVDRAAEKCMEMLKEEYGDFEEEDAHVMSLGLTKESVKETINRINNLP